MVDDIEKEREREEAKFTQQSIDSVQDLPYSRARGFVQSDFGLREGYSSPLFH